MEKIIVSGGQKLSGRVDVGGAKNAALPILLSAIVTDQPCVFSQVPHLQDIHTTLSILNQMGVHTSAHFAKELGQTSEVTIHAKNLTTTEAPYDLVRKMRASFIVLGPCLARMGHAKVSLPGGCAIGARPVDIHLKGFEQLGAEIKIEGGYVLAKAKRGKLQGGRVQFRFPSVGATENLMMAAVLAEGETRLENCAREPEIVNLADFLRSLGAVIEGDGSSVILIQGGRPLKGSRFKIMGDRIEAGTYLAAAFATGGEIVVHGVEPSHLESVLKVLESAGAVISRGNSSIGLKSLGRPKAVRFQTEPFPGFPTDMQAQIMAVAALADGESHIQESVFENRFMHVPELCRLGADITITGSEAVVRGQEKLYGAQVMATDLRASASLIIAGLCAGGQTTVNRIYHLDRGYEFLEKKLASLGAVIERVK